MKKLVLVASLFVSTFAYASDDVQEEMTLPVAVYSKIDKQIVVQVKDDGNQDNQKQDLIEDIQADYATEIRLNVVPKDLDQTSGE